MNTNIHIIFRTTAAGDIINVTELNTRITYKRDCRLTLGRLVVSYSRVLIRKTIRARFRYFMHNNRVARFKRAVGPAMQQGLSRVGVRVYVA
jgi:hypothetical protein